MQETPQRTGKSEDKCTAELVETQRNGAGGGFDAFRTVCAAPSRVVMLESKGGMGIWSSFRQELGVLTWNCPR